MMPSPFGVNRDLLKVAGSPEGFKHFQERIHGHHRQKNPARGATGLAAEVLLDPQLIMTAANPRHPKPRWPAAREPSMYTGRVVKVSFLASHAPGASPCVFS
jgi:hypothetical protein